MKKIKHIFFSNKIREKVLVERKIIAIVILGNLIFSFFFFCVIFNETFLSMNNLHLFEEKKLIILFVASTKKRKLILVTFTKSLLTRLITRKDLFRFYHVLGIAGMPMDWTSLFLDVLYSIIKDSFTKKNTINYIPYLYQIWFEFI